MGASMFGMETTPLKYRVQVEFDGRVRESEPLSLANAVFLKAATRAQGLEDVRIVPA